MVFRGPALLPSQLQSGHLATHSYLWLVAVPHNHMTAIYSLLCQLPQMSMGEKFPPPSYLSTGFLCLCCKSHSFSPADSPCPSHSRVSFPIHAPPPSHSHAPNPCWASCASPHAPLTPFLTQQQPLTCRPALDLRSSWWLPHWLWLWVASRKLPLLMTMGFS